MDKLTLTLITGRSTRQGTGISSGKEKPDYREAVNRIDLSPADMERSGLEDGAVVRLQTEFGSAEAVCRRADMPEGLAFMAFGSVCNRLVGGETYASGMPDSKHVEVEIMPVSSSEFPVPG